MLSDKRGSNYSLSCRVTEFQFIGGVSTRLSSWLADINTAPVDRSARLSAATRLQAELLGSVARRERERERTHAG